MVPVVAGERDCPIVDVLAVDNYKVDVVIFEYPFFYLAYDFPHAPQSEEGIRRYPSYLEILSEGTEPITGG
jgi:hypothetical protein